MREKSITILANAAVAVVVLVVTMGCYLRDDTGTEPITPPEPIVVPVEVEFTTNAKGEDLIKEVLGGFHLFIFDEGTRMLVAVEEVKRAQIISGDIALRLPPGLYTFVAWGGSGERLDESGFEVVDPVNEYAQEYGEVEVGKTTLESFRLKVTTTTHADDYTIPADGAFDELFYAMAERVRIEPDKDPNVNFNFIRNSNLLRVKLVGIDWLATRAAFVPKVYVTGRNGSFTYDNNISPYAEIIRYDAPRGTVDGNQLTMDIRLLRLDMARHKKDPMWLWVEDAANNNIIARIDVMSTILKETDNYGRPRYKSQGDIDREEMFEIRIEFREPDPVTGNITIIVNDWVFGEYAPGGIKPWVPKTPEPEEEKRRRYK